MRLTRFSAMLQKTDPIHCALCRRGVAALVAGMIAACSSKSAGVTPVLTLSVVAGDQQSVIATLPVPIAPEVKLVDGNGQPVAGVTVTFAENDSLIGGSNASSVVTGGIQTTAADGTAEVGGWTPGAAGAHLLTATVPGAAGSPVRFGATSTQYVLIVNKVTGNAQSAPVGTAVARPPSVKVQLYQGGVPGPVVGAAVTFVVTGGGGSVTGGVTTTDANGIATVGSWVLGPNPGTNTLDVIVSPLTEVQTTFTATGTP